MGCCCAASGPSQVGLCFPAEGSPLAASGLTVFSQGTAASGLTVFSQLLLLYLCEARPARVWEPSLPSLELCTACDKGLSNPFLHGSLWSGLCHTCLKESWELAEAADLAPV